MFLVIDSDFVSARCTSAAPWYFRAQELKNLGTFQDGGLQHNMPMDVAYWEKENIWPEKQGLDFGISIGTGTRKVPITSSLGHQSPVKQGCASRMFNAFLERIDGQREWWRFRNSLCPTIRKRIYRLNIPLTKEPSIDDISSIPALQKQTEDYLGTISGHLTDIMDSIYASMFYFELDSVPEYIDGIYHCHGFVLCRLNLTQKGLLHLYHWLVTGSAFFLINGRPVACARLIPKGTPSFRCRIQFTVPDLEEQLGISIRGVTSKPSIISGLPQSILALIENQVMDAPFGRVGHSPSRKALPRIPQKRKLSETSKNTHFLSCY
jgi:hypothetical protein